MMRIYTYLSLPGLIIHELMHIIFGIISGRIFSISESYTLWRNDGALSVGLVPKKDKSFTLFQMLLVPLAPLYLIIAIAILAFFNPIFIAVLIYFIATWMYSFPSAGDFEMVRYAKLYIKYKHTDPVFVRFMNSKIDQSVDLKVDNELEFLEFQLED
jgi:hypothetical protein